jgi:cyclic pyranopterin phosphate synthase
VLRRPVDVPFVMLADVEVGKPALERAHRPSVASATLRGYARPRLQRTRGSKTLRYAPLVTLDTLHRPLRDLRISVTDRCNFRCVYCMPKEVFGRDYRFLDRRELLTFEEIERLTRSFVRAGVGKVRLTGGEPLLRRDLERLVELLARIDELDLTLTTNGALLAQKARALADAGLTRVTVSLDSLDDETFRQMNDVDFPVERVLEGIEAAAAAGLAPVKVNVVVKRGLNEDGIVPMAAHFRGTGHVLRFIEYMDVGSTNGWRMDDVVPASEILAAIADEFPLEAAEPAYRGEVARRYRYVDGAGEIGVIASVTQPFCGDCTRARLSAEGRLYTCLFALRGHDLRALVRGGATDRELDEAIDKIWSRRGDRYSELRSAETAQLPKVEMSYIGG